MSTILARLSGHCQFEHYADKLQSATGALSDHIIHYHHITQTTDPETILSGKATVTLSNSNNI